MQLLGILVLKILKTFYFLIGFKGLFYNTLRIKIQNNKYLH